MKIFDNSYKRFAIFIALLIIINNSYAQSYAGYSRMFDIESGYKFTTIYKSGLPLMFHAASFELDYHAPLLYTSYLIRAEVGPGYWAIEPFSALGFTWMLLAQNFGDFDNYAPGVKTMIVILAASAMKIPIRINYGMFELCPSYSVLRLTHINDGYYDYGSYDGSYTYMGIQKGYYLTGSLALSFNYYVNKYLYVYVRGDFNWGYTKNFGLGYSVLGGLGIQIPFDKK